jgi:outer membrane protein TolC
MYLHRKKTIAIAVLASLALSACTSIQPTPFTQEDLSIQTKLDRLAAQKDVEPIVGQLSLEEAIARALKYNLDRRSKMLEEAMALKQLDVTSFDMLPKILANAGYNSRSNDLLRLSRNQETGQLAPSQFISQDQSHNIADLGISWNLLDLGVGYYNSQQQADRVLIAAEKRRKAMHLLMQDTRTAFWRAIGAQKLKQDVKAAIATAEEALVDSRKAEGERVRNPLDALRYQRQVLENLRLLESIDQELASANIELAVLINIPIGQPVELAEPPMTLQDKALSIPIDVMEEVAMTENSDIREQHYNARIARQETRKTLIRLFPNLNFNYGSNYDSDSFLINSSWNEIGFKISFNLFNLLTAPTQIKLAEAGVNLAEQRRMTVQMATLAQVHLARLQMANMNNQYHRADAIWNADQRIAEHMKNREAVETQSKLDLVSNQTTAILSLLRRYQALALAQAAEARLQASLGIEPKIGSISEITLAELTATLSRSKNVWDNLTAPLD